MDIRVTIPIPPHGKGAPRATLGRKKTASGVEYFPKMRKHDPTREWEKKFAQAVAFMLPRRLPSTALWVDIAAIFDRTKELCFIYKRTGLPKYSPGLIPYPQKPDLDNVRKAVQDALRAHWDDDKLVCLGKTVEAYRELNGKPRVSIRIRVATEEEVTRAVHEIEGTSSAVC